jgi:YVTN family beta-propeller protein
MKKSIVYCIVFLLFGLPVLLSAQSGYKLAGKIPIGGEGGWDYITFDEMYNRLFVSHAMLVNVVDLATGKVTGTIPDTKGVHGIAVATDLNKGFTSNGRDSSVTVFNLKDLSVMAIVKVTGRNPDCILYDAFSKKVFTFNGGSASTTVIDAVDNKVVATLKLHGKPEFAVTNGKGTVYVNIEDKSEIQVIDTKKLEVTGGWSLSPGEEPSGLALDNKNHRLFSVCGNKLMVVSDATSGKVITTLPIGSRCDGVAFDPGLNRAYSSNGEGNITVVQETNANTFNVLETLPTQQGARTITVNPGTHHLYLPTADYDYPSGAARPSVKPGTFTVLDVEKLP